jgi:hypothetical protein
MAQCRTVAARRGGARHEHWSLPMTTRVRRVEACSITAPSRAGEGARILGELKEAGVNLIAFTGTPTRSGRARLDLVAEELGGILDVARAHNWRVSRKKHGFLVQGLDEVGAVYRHIKRLGDRGINVTAADAVAAGEGLFGMLLWVGDEDCESAAAALGVR